MASQTTADYATPPLALAARLLAKAKTGKINATAHRPVQENWQRSLKRGMHYLGKDWAFALSLSRS